MSRTKYAEDCPGCRPVAIDMKTGRPLPDDHPMMRTLAAIWQKTGPLHKAAFHRVTCLNNKSMLDLALAREYIQEVEAAAKGDPQGDDAKPTLQ